MDEFVKPEDLAAQTLRSRLSRRGLLRRVAVLGLATPVVGTLLAACGGSSETATKPAEATKPAGGGTEATKPAEATQPAGSTPEATAPSGGAEATATESGSGSAEPAGKIVIIQGVDANSLDPLLRNSTPEFNLNLHIYDMFLKRDAETLELVPNIVEKWESVDTNTWHLTLVEGAKFHDGTPVDPAAVVFTFDRANKPKIGEKPRVSSFAKQIGYVSSSALDAKTVEIKTNKPAALLPSGLASLEVCPPSYFTDESPENLAKIAESPMGSGPYKFVEWKRDDHFTCEANPDYWGKKPSIKTVTFRPVPELSARVVSLQNDEAQIVTNIAPDVAPQVDQSDNARISKVTGGRIIFLGIRCDKPPFDDVRVRQALNYAVDFDSIITALLDDNGERASTIVNPPHQNKDLKPYAYDPEKAKALLAEAGVAPGFEITMDAPSGRYIKDAEMAQAIAQNFEAIGLKVNLKVLEWSVYAGELLPSGEPDPVYFLGLGAPFTGEQELYYVHPDYSLNYTRWNNADFNSLYDKLTNSLDEKERQDLMNKLQAIVMDDCPWVPLWHQVDFYGASKKIKWEARADERIDATEASYIS